MKFKYNGDHTSTFTYRDTEPNGSIVIQNDGSGITYVLRSTRFNMHFTPIVTQTNQIANQQAAPSYGDLYRHITTNVAYKCVIVNRALMTVTLESIITSKAFDISWQELYKEYAIATNQFGFIPTGKQFQGQSGITLVASRPPLPSVGDRLRHTESGMECEVADSWPTDSKYLIWHINPGYAHYVIVMSIDIWNYYSWWEDGSSPSPNMPKKKCEHVYVNVSFNGLNMRCKFCDISEDEGRGKQKAEVLDGV